MSLLWRLYIRTLWIMSLSDSGQVNRPAQRGQDAAQDDNDKETQERPAPPTVPRAALVLEVWVWAAFGGLAVLLVHGFVLREVGNQSTLRLTWCVCDLVQLASV